MKSVIKLMTYSKKYWKYLNLSMIAIVIMTATQLYAPLVVRELTALITNNDKELANKSIRLAVVLAVVYVIQAICQFIRSYFTHYAAWNFVAEMREKVYDHMQRLSLRFYHDKQTGQLMSRVANDTANLEVLIAHAAPDLIVNVLILVGVTIILFLINFTLALLSLITIPFLLISSDWFAKKVRPSFKNGQQALAELNATLQDNLSGVKEIQIFNQEDKEKKKVKEAANKHSKYLIKALKKSAVYHPLVQFLSNFGTVIVIGYGGYMASVGKVPIEDIVAFIMYLAIFYQPINALARINEDMQSSIASAERILEVLETESEVTEINNPVNLKRMKGKIEFKNLSFSYNQNMKVLNNINLLIKPNQVVALVGPTGVGKTTIVSLVGRFYDPTEGAVLFDDTDIKNVSLKSLRDNISIVLQDVFLFNGTIAENIAYGYENMSMEEITKAAKTAHAHEFIEQLEDGYNTYIGERGIKLSGGQKQRISIARAVLRNKPILILDEATASIDVETEKHIHEAIDEVIKDRTTIIIAHRLSTVKKADVIVVLNEGKIEEMGTHEELINKKGMYFHMCEIQFYNDN